MLSNILSYFWKSADIAETELSLEGACSVLKEQFVDDKDIGSTLNSLDKPLNNFSVRVGTITKCVDSNYVIDGLYSFSTEEKKFTVGSRVSYDYFTCNNKENILNIKLAEDDWELSSTCDTLWNTRIIICKVVNRINRNIVLSHENITVDLDNVSVEFLPVVGDWLELDIKCSINENSIDLSGQIIEINKISPVRAHIEGGVITKWDSSDKNGIINRNVYFNKHSLSRGYVPVVGDKVVVEIIESDQNRCSWRALKVIPENISKCGNIFKTSDLPVSEIQDQPGLCIDLPLLSFTRLKESTSFFITISNISENSYILLSAKFSRINSQCKILDVIESPKVVSKGMSHKISCECTAKNVGSSKELLLLTFENFTLSRWININVTIGCNRGLSNHFERKSKSLDQSPSGNQLVRGQRVSAPPRFIATQLPNYAIPKKLLDVVFRYGFTEEAALREELRSVNPSLFSNLTHTNYEDKFHSLLYLDEISNLIMIRNYDQDKACFIANDEFLMLEIENLAERRPSIILGDKIIATDPLSKSGVDFEGFVHKVGAKHVYLKFSHLFHDKYNGEDYSIKVVPSRSSYRKLHHAVYLAARNLGKEILFPTRVYDKEPQVKILFNENSFDSNDDDLIRKKKLNPSNVLNKLIEINKLINNNPDRENIRVGGSLGKEEFMNLKLEWYNNSLNSKQKDAVVNVLMGVARPLPYIIFGPPGTGKTVTIIEIVLQIIRLIPHSRLLITAPSNSASDLIAMRLIKSGVLKPGDLVRLVSYNYAISELIPVTLVPYCATGSLARDGTTATDVPQAGIQYDCSRSALGRHRITVSTCSAAGQLYSMGFPKGHFSHIIVDEAAQASEPDVLIPLAFLDKFSGQVILAGDPMQLGPVVLSRLAGECGLEESFLERICCTFPYSKDPEGFTSDGGYDPRLLTKLLYNYRSLPPILKLSSSLFYDDELIPTIDEDSKEAALSLQLKDILPKTKMNNVAAIVFHGVNGVNFQNTDSPSWYNPHEAAQVFYYINEFYRMGLTSKQIGIITPYIKQVKEIRSLLIEAEFDVPKIGTVEEFQGQEFDVIVLSTVRSCEDFISNDIIHSLGFVSSPRRLNVAISRSKSLLVIIGNPGLLCHDTYWRSVIQYCFESGAYVGCDFLLS